MAVSNLVKEQPDDHVKRIAEFATDAIKVAQNTYVDEADLSKGCVNIRVGKSCIYSVSFLFFSLLQDIIDVITTI